MIFVKTRVCNDENLNQLYYNGITCVCLCFCCPVKDLIITLYLLNSIFSYTQVVFFFIGKIFISISELFLLFIFFFFRKIFYVLFFSEFFFVFDNIYLPFFMYEEKNLIFFTRIFFIRIFSSEFSFHVNFSWMASSELSS